RADRRRQLERAAPGAEADTAAPPRPALRVEADPATEGDTDEWHQALPVQTEARRVVVPRFGAAAAASIAAAPPHIAASAIRTAAMLAAGDRAAWDRVKQAKDMPRPVLMSRIGFHRLLFRTADGSLDVLDLVARRDLLLALKRLRCAER
ncbi:MAG TPA: hypothetical protein VHT91_22485, partial [Kofleriaceae bacterium]|nr:hypothetical protein [Kofleriaceae bacterium]